jgi:general secretion pathway protein N
MPKGRSLAAVGIGLFLIFLIALLPARVAIGWLAPPAVTLNGVSGTIWSGSAAQVGLNGRLIGRLRWSDGSLLALIGRPGWRFELDRNDGFLRGRVRLTLGGSATGRDLEGATSLSALQSLAPVGGAEGDVSIRLDELSLEKGRLERIRGRVVIDGLRPSGLREGNLGTISVRFPLAPETPLTGAIEVEGGPISVRDGRIALQPDGSYEIGGRVAAAPDAPRDITQAMQYMGSPDPEGYREFSLAGSP